jgi:hypothetical protein
MPVARRQVKVDALLPAISNILVLLLSRILDDHQAIRAKQFELSALIATASISKLVLS